MLSIIHSNKSLSCKSKSPASPKQCCDVDDDPGIALFNALLLYPELILIGFPTCALNGSNTFKAHFLALSKCVGSLI